MLPYEKQWIYVAEIETKVSTTVHLVKYFMATSMNFIYRTLTGKGLRISIPQV